MTGVEMTPGVAAVVVVCLGVVAMVLAWRGWEQVRARRTAPPCDGRPDPLPAVLDEHAVTDGRRGR